jgi:putative transposase
VAKAEDWPWSSARAHLAGRGDALVDPAPLLGLVADWHGFLAEGMADGEVDTLRRHAANGAPAVSAAALEQLEARFERPLRIRPRGRPPRN